MIIAVNKRFTKSSQGNGYEQVMNTTLRALAQKYPQDQFLFIYDRPWLPEISFPDNVKIIVAGPETSNRLRLKYWLNYKLPALLKKHKADILINTDGCCSLRTKKPQCLLVNDLGFLEHPQGMKRSIARFYKKNMQDFISKAGVVAAGSEFIQKQLKEKYEIDKPLELILPGIDETFVPLDWKEKEQVKESHSDGKDYFLCSGSIETKYLLTILKAFTLFKKRQKSSMLLLIVGEVDPAFKKEFKSYRLRNEVRILENLSTRERSAITGTAYAMLHIADHGNMEMPVLESMRSAVPVITSNIPSIITVYEDAALYTITNDPKDIAENMMLLYKDEDLAKKLVAAGMQLAKRQEPASSAGILMQCINKAFNA